MEGAEYNFATRFIGLAGEINRRMPEFVVEKTLRLLNTMGLAPSRAKILMIGLAYKKDLGDYRNSPALRIAELLLEYQVELLYHDPYIIEMEVSGKYFHSVELSAGLLQQVDLVLIATDHSRVD